MRKITAVIILAVAGLGLAAPAASAGCFVPYQVGDPRGLRTLVCQLG